MRFLFISASLVALATAEHTYAEAETTTYTCPQAADVKFHWRAPTTDNVGSEWFPLEGYKGYFHPDITFKSVAFKNELPDMPGTEHTFIYCTYTFPSASPTQEVTLYYNTKYDLRKRDCKVEGESVTCS